MASMEAPGILTLRAGSQLWPEPVSHCPSIGGSSGANRDKENKSGVEGKDLDVV